MDSNDRELLVRQYVERIRHNPTEAQEDEAVAAIVREWQHDVQDVHERSYSDGAEGVLA
jgi:hypothetical protein